MKEEWIFLLPEDLPFIDKWINRLLFRRKLLVYAIAFSGCCLFIAGVYTLVVLLLFLLLITFYNILTERIETHQKDLEINKKYVLSGQVEEVEEYEDDNKITYYKIGNKELRQRNLKLQHGQNCAIHFAYVSGKILYIDK